MNGTEGWNNTTNASPSGYKNVRPGPSRQQTNANVIGKKMNAKKLLYDGSDILSSRLHPEKCSMNSFLNKRREILMINMSINTQQEEIDKLGRDLKEKEASLNDKEASLNESMRRFNCFLKELDQKARDAANLLENQLQIKAEKEKVQKELQSQINVVESRLRQQKCEDEESSLCRELICSLSPQEWFKDHADKKRIRQRERRRNRIEKRIQEFRQQQQQLKQEEESQTRQVSGRKSMRRQRQSPSNTDPKEPDFEDEQLTSSDEECPLYFEDSEQLLTALTNMENLNKKIQEREVVLRELQVQTNSLKDNSNLTNNDS